MTQTTSARTIQLENPFAPLDGLCELLLVRHGEQVLTIDQSVDDAVDPPLSELGLRQVEAVGQRLADREIHAIYSSPLARALQTGESIGKHHGIVPTPLDELREFHPWASFEGTSFRETLGAEEVKRIFRDHLRTKSFAPFPYAEDRDRFRARINGVVAGIVDRHPGERVVITCHSGVINAVLASVLETDQDMPVRVHHTSISVFRGADTRRAVVSVNDFAHVLDLQDAVNPFNL